MLNKAFILTFLFVMFSSGTVIAKEEENPFGIEHISSDRVIAWAEGLTYEMQSFFQGLANPWLIIVILLIAKLIVVGIFLRQYLAVAFNLFIGGVFVFILLNYSTSIVSLIRRFAQSMFS